MRGTRRWAVGLILLLAASLLSGTRSALAGETAEGSAITARAIDAVQLLSEGEQRQLLPWLFSAIERQPDVRVRADLSRRLTEALRKSGAMTPGWGRADEPLEEPTAVIEERRRLAALLTAQSRDADLSEDEIRRRIEELTLDPAEPELTLNHAMELSRIIRQQPDRPLRETLQRFLTDRLTALQAGLEDLEVPADPLEEGAQDIPL